MSTDGRILVTFSAVETAAADCGVVANNMNQQLDELKTYLNPLVGSWTGEAAERYRALEAQWQQSAGDLTAVLLQIQKALDSAYQNYSATETANAKIWG
jgi:early secretory antigenic target protein ESAT-6